MRKFWTVLQDESGATLIEYALLATLIGVACIVSMQTLAGKLNSDFNSIGTSIAR